MLTVALFAFATTSGYLTLPKGPVFLNGQKVASLARVEVGSSLLLKGKASAIYVSKSDMRRYLLVSPFQGKSLVNGLSVITGKVRKLDTLAKGSAEKGGEFGQGAGFIVRSSGTDRFSWIWPAGSVLPKDLAIRWKGTFAAGKFRVRVFASGDEEVWSRTVGSADRQASCPRENLKPGQTYRVEVEAMIGEEPDAEIEQEVKVVPADLADYVQKLSGGESASADFADLLESFNLLEESANLLSHNTPKNQAAIERLYAKGAVK